MNDYETYEVRVYKNGDKFWYQNERCHRTDGPAIESANGYKAWWQHDKRHRTDGPAIEYENGEKSWYIDGVKHTEEEFKKKINSCEGKTVTVDGKEYRLIDTHINKW